MDTKTQSGTEKTRKKKTTRQFQSKWFEEMCIAHRKIEKPIVVRVCIVDRQTILPQLKRVLRQRPKHQTTECFGISIRATDTFAQWKPPFKMVSVLFRCRLLSISIFNTDTFNSSPCLYSPSSAFIRLHSLSRSRWANRSFSFSMKCTSVTFNLICCFDCSKRFALSSSSCYCVCCDLFCVLSIFGLQHNFSGFIDISIIWRRPTIGGALQIVEGFNGSGGVDACA